MKLYSIIITCYNREKFISKAIRSALNQININREMLEVIVVDDFSKDSSVEKIQEFVPLIKFIQNRKNFGVALSRNKGIKISKGKYILMLDSDDYISSNFLEIMSFYLDNNNYWDAAACDYTKVDQKGKFIKRYNFKKTPIACGILFRREKFFEIGLYNKCLRINEEKDLRKKFFKKKFRMGYVELPLYRYVMHDDNITKKINDK
jgi:glycosyltransferase involved in cell wall biosynthesis